MANKKSAQEQQNDDLSAIRRHSYMRILTRELPNPPPKQRQKKTPKQKAKAPAKSKKRS